jgi:hypothetical protein
MYFLTFFLDCTLGVFLSYLILKGTASLSSRGWVWESWSHPGYYGRASLRCKCFGEQLFQWCIVTVLMKVRGGRAKRGGGGQRPGGGGGPRIAQGGRSEARRASEPGRASESKPAERANRAGRANRARRANRAGRAKRAGKKNVVFASLRLCR